MFPRRKCARQSNVFKQPDPDALALFSRAAGLAALLFFLPALVVLGALVAVTSPGPTLIRRAYRRPHADSLVLLYEFRTECWHTWRPTPLGAILARADLHRLPHLLNVLAGDVMMGEAVKRA